MMKQTVKNKDAMPNWSVQKNIVSQCLKNDDLPRKPN